MKLILSVPIVAMIACVIAGCGPKVRPSLSMERQQRYGRLAIVCAPGPQANSDYAPMVLKEAQSMISHLKFLEKADCLFDVSVDTASTPPVVDVNAVRQYDAVVALVYSYDSGRVFLDFYMTDAKTGEQIWHHKFDTTDPAIKKRLLADGLSVPAIIKKEFYGL